mmetsp:Transcript_11822/g.22743  ORF Transcript_11822/g.22743 Transcript_11822/m.22743 type:complete len:366 (+) Transcript_11822:253-1350(+)
MSIKVTLHVITLGLHVSTHLVKGGSRDEMALAVHLPGDGRVLRADEVVTRRSGCGSSVLGNIGTLFSIDNHTAHQVRPVVSLVIHNGKDLGLNTNLRGSIGKNTIHAEDTIIERGLVLVGSTASTGSRMGPMDFISLTNLHANAVLPVEFAGELGVTGIVMTAAISGLFTTVHSIRTEVTTVRTISFLVEFTNRKMLRTQVPVDIDGAHAVHPVRGGNGNMINFHTSDVSLCDIGTGLGTNIGHGIDNTLDIGKIGLLSFANIDSCSKRDDVVGDIVDLVGDCRAVGGSGTAVDNDRGGRGIRAVSFEGDEGSKLSHNNESNSSQNKRQEGGLGRTGGGIGLLFSINVRDVFRRCGAHDGKLLSL